MRRGLPLLLAVAAATLLSLFHSAEIRQRAEVALGKGMPAREAELARGFVLGEDERIDSRTVEDFRRSGLSHLLAVSGQNVALLALLAMALLAALGMSLRVRLAWVLGLIAAYVPLAGAGPTIQRAAIMGGLGVLATLAGRRASRLYALLLAAIVTLAIAPRIATDVGWQLSFVAVLGILLLASPLQRAIVARLGNRGWRRALAEGASMTIAATLATAPLISFHFGTVSTTTLLANLLALPAVAPAMWLGMLAAAGGQVPWAPVETLNSINAPLLAYIAQVAAWCGRPDWAYLEVEIGSAGLIGAYVGLAAAGLAVGGLARSQRAAARKSRSRRSFLRSRRTFERRKATLRAAVAAGAIALALAVGVGDGVVAGPPTGTLRISVLDVGQGDAILLQPSGAAPVLVDTGPPGAGIAAMIGEAGVDRLGAVFLTHDQSDHAGGLTELLAEVPVDRVLFASLGRPTSIALRVAGAGLQRVAAGRSLHSGLLRLDVLWPPRELLADVRIGADPNHLSLVLLLRWRGFAMLLSGDAEAESIPLDPGPIDVLKLAHHGSDDAGLAELLDRARPRLALISVGADNPFGHPTPTTLSALATRGVRILRTDRAGTIVLEVGSGSLAVAAGG
jgi:competence protein ComEC